MAAIKVKTKNKCPAEGKSRVYFTCHPDDFNAYFQTICDDIFAIHDCAVYYTENMTEIILQTDEEIDLCHSHLLVVPVTDRLLSTPNRAMDVDIPYAMQQNIPVLPIVMETVNDDLYAMPDKFADLQYLSRREMDTTQIPYRKKLETYLSTVLISDELRQHVREAFDVHIFLSYRRKDRCYANEVMKQIRNLPDCEKIAVWFDEFLLPGTHVVDSIDAVLCNSKLFTLVVTPNLLEESNFVMLKEYPAAVRLKLPQLPVEMVKTDRKALEQKYPQISPLVKTSDPQFEECIKRVVNKHVSNKKTTAEYYYFLGLAYLAGINVEMNRAKGKKLIQSAAQAQLPEAMRQLHIMYDKGIGQVRDYQKALDWAKKEYICRYRQAGETAPETQAAFRNLHEYCEKHFQPHIALEARLDVMRAVRPELEPKVIKPSLGSIHRPHREGRTGLFNSDGRIRVDKGNRPDKP
jgi:hypothetical protein